MEIVYTILAVQFKPTFVSFITPTNAVGVSVHILLLVAVFRVSRWFCIPWLIYIMLIVVGLSLAAVLSVVIPVGTSSKEPNWLLVTLIPVGLLGLAGLYLYFWIVVLELFIKMGPLYYVDGNLYGTQPNNLPPPPVPMHAVPMIYGSQGAYIQNNATNGISTSSNMGPQSMIYQPTQPIIYTQPQPHSYIQTSQQQQMYFQQIHQQQIQQQQQQQQKSQLSMQ